MKKVYENRVLLVLITILILGALLIQSCIKDPVNPPPPPVTFTMTSIINGKGSLNPDKKTGIKQGSKLEIKFTPDSTYSLHTVKINEIHIKEIPESETEVFYSTDVYFNLFVKVDFVKTDILMLSVESLSENPWMLESINYYNFETNKLIYSAILEEEEKTDKRYFLYPSFDLVFIRQNGSVSTSKWDLKDRILQIGGGYFPIVEFTKTKMSYKSGPLPGGSHGTIYAVSTFKK
jgi:hypothetical protein